MSSFICSAKHFNSITENATSLINNCGFNDSPLRKFGLNDLSLNELRIKIKSIINILKCINVICWVKQYKAKNAVELFELVNEKSATKKLSPLGLKNAIDCLSYQIEIDYLTEERELEKDEILALDFLVVFKNLICEYILNNMPDDKTNAWSID